MITQVWVGGGPSELGWTLCCAGGWFVGSYMDEFERPAIQLSLDKGWLTKRTHYSQMFPEGAEAYELTDAGAEKLRELQGDEMTEEALKARQWYRDHLALWKRDPKLAYAFVCEHLGLKFRT